MAKSLPPSPQRNLRYAWQLARKELRHNRTSSLLIILVVAAICLPMQIVTSLKEGYIRILNEQVSQSTQATRVDISRPTGREDLTITDSVLHAFRTLDGVGAAVPQKRRTVSLFNADSSDQVDFEALTTIPEDPDLKRFGFRGTFNEDVVAENELGIIIQRNDLLELGIDTTQVPAYLGVLVDRTSGGRSETYALKCKVLGTLDGGKPGTVYIPVPMGKKLARWTTGLGVKEYALPPAANREEALPALLYDSCLVLSPVVLDDKRLDPLRGMDVAIYLAEEQPYNTLFSYTVRPADVSVKLTESRRETIQDILSPDVEVAVVPYVPPLELRLFGKVVTLRPSYMRDPRKSRTLSAGVWFNTYRSRMEIMLPETDFAESFSMRARDRVTLGKDSVALFAAGLVNESHGYIDYQTLYRLHQVQRGVAVYDLVNETFDRDEKSPYEDRFLFARIHAADIGAVVGVVDHFRTLGYDIFASSRAEVENIQRTNTILTKFMLLIVLTGALAGLASIFVLMYEAVKRKKNQIGIMRAMGLSKTFITDMLIMQSLVYGLVGYAIAFGLFKGLSLFLDNELAHQVLGLAGLEGNIFSTSLSLIAGFILGILAVGWVAGRSASASIKRVDPADILSD